MTGYINRFDENKNKNKNKYTIKLSLKVKDKQHWKTYNKTWKHKYMKTKIKTYEDSINANFYNKKGSKKCQKNIT